MSMADQLVSESSFQVEQIEPTHVTAVPLRQARYLAMAFVLYGLVATAMLATIMPPFQNPDEPNHFLRAAQLADGTLVGSRFSAMGADGSSRLTAGGWTDPALMMAISQFNSLRFHSDRRATRANWEPRIYWSGARVMQRFQNTAIYPPFFYVPSTIGVLVGRLARNTVVETLKISRIMNGIAAVAVGAVAIACAGGAAVWIFMILTLPMSFSLIASSSQDALLLSCSALVGALLVRALRWPSGSSWKLLIGLIVALGMVSMARPPYGALAVLPFALTKVHLRWRVLAAAAIAGIVVVWSAITVVTTLTNTGEFIGSDPVSQMSGLVEDPMMLVHVVWNTLIQNWRSYLTGFVGQLGWLDVALPRPYHVAAQVMLGIAALAAMLGLKGERISVGSRFIITVGLMLSVLGIFAIQYLTWTVPGHATVEGVQGRYFLPLALAGTGLLPALGNTRLMQLHDVLVAAVLVFPVVTLAFVMNAVVLRYYLG
jgi:uncharacterized membrane protein